MSVQPFGAYAEPFRFELELAPRELCAMHGGGYQTKAVRLAPQHYHALVTYRSGARRSICLRTAARSAANRSLDAMSRRVLLERGGSL